MQKKFKNQAAWVAYLAKQELKQKFPGVKFSVKSSSYAGGNSVDVRYEYSTKGNASLKEVNEVLQKYRAGSFDGMTDCYNYNHGIKGPTAMYVFAQLDYPYSVIRAVNDRIGDMRPLPSPQEFNSAYDAELIAQGY